MFGNKLFKPQDNDVKMWRAARTSHLAPVCTCLAPQYEGNGTFDHELQFHTEVQDTECDAWKLLDILVEAAAVNGASDFAPGLEMPPELWSQLVTLPPSIAKLTSVRRLYLYGSHLVRLPPEVGRMSSLVELDIYTSYRLHWLPYEVTRCTKLKLSRASTRALYGNYKYRPPFPRLAGAAAHNIPTPDTCSVCNGPCSRETAIPIWISLKVATDVLPLLANACSAECVTRLPTPAPGYVDRPHTGGLRLQQPPSRH